METKETTTVTSSAPVQKKSNNKVIIIVVVVLLVLCCICSLVGAAVYYLNDVNTRNANQTIENGTNPNPNTPTNPSTPTNPTNPQQDRGGSFTDLDGSFDVRIDDVIKNGEDYEIEMSVKNTSDEAQTFSTILFLQVLSELNEDGYSQNFFSARYRDEEAQLDGEIAPGATKSGVVVYTVDDGASDVYLRVSEGLFSDSYVDFDL